MGKPYSQDLRERVIAAVDTGTRAYGVHHDDIALAQDRDHKLLDVGAKARAIHRSIEHTRRGDLPDAQRGDECCGLPVSARHTGYQALTARAAAIAARHVGCGASYVDENQAFCGSACPGSSCHSFRAWATSGRYPARQLAPTFFEREFEKIEPVPQAPDADFDLPLGERPNVCAVRRA